MLFLVTLLTSLAARPTHTTCPWEDIYAVSTTPRTISINGVVFPVAGRPAYDTGRTEIVAYSRLGGGYIIEERRVTTKGERYWVTMHATLEGCGEPEAAESLRRWRANQRVMNWSWVLTPYSLPITVYAYLRVKTFRRHVEEALERVPHESQP